MGGAPRAAGSIRTTMKARGRAPAGPHPGSHYSPTLPPNSGGRVEGTSSGSAAGFLPSPTQFVGEGPGMGCAPRAAGFPVPKQEPSARPTSSQPSSPLSARNERGGAGGGAPRRRSGFTLVEMMVVLMMIGAGAMVVAPALRRPDERGASPSADALAAAIGRARLAAVTRAVPVMVEVDVAGGRWTTVAHPADRQSDTVDAGALPLSSDTRLAGGDGAYVVVMFDGLGRARADRLTVSDRGGAQEIEVDAWTGAARVRPR